jgi:hypothetical protein
MVRDGVIESYAVRGQKPKSLPDRFGNRMYLRGVLNTMLSESIVQNYLDDALSSFKAYKKLADKAIEQMKDEEFFVTLDEEANSVAVVMKHMAGNMLSRWTDFLNSDGEKPNRNRDLEFVIEPQTTKDDLMVYWESGWQAVFTALEPLRPEDFERKVTIRGE